MQYTTNLEDNILERIKTDQEQMSIDETVNQQLKYDISEYAK